MKTKNEAVSIKPYEPAIQSALRQAASALSHLTNLGLTVEFQLANSNGNTGSVSFDKDSDVTIVTRGTAKVPGHD